MAQSSALIPRIVMLLALTAAGVLSLRSVQAPSLQAVASDFQLDRAMKHLQFIARKPHPVASPHHAAVREYLMRELQELGLEVEVQETRTSNRRFLRGLPFEVRNVVARLRGSARSSKAVMLACHYDSTPLGGAASPGAGDDGAAVAALLEVARILVPNPPHNDIIFLFTDGEEIALLGAQAFIDQHRWRGDVGVVFNFEARGTSGASIMFQTSSGNAVLVREFARVAPAVVATSLSEFVYRLMPNTTDFKIFRKGGHAGMDFAFIGDYVNYHTAGDSIANLDQRSMQHHGVQALALARHFGQLNLASLASNHNSIYFTVGPRRLVIYPAAWAIPLALAAALAAGLAALVALRCGMLRARSVMWGLVVMGLATGLAVGSAWIVLKLFSPDVLGRSLALAIGGFTALSLLCTVLMLWLFRRRDEGISFGMAGLLIWATLGPVAAIYAPGASYLPAWPTLFGALSFAFFAHRRSRGDRWGESLLLIAGALPAVMLMTPVIYLAFIGMRVQTAPIMCSVIVVASWLVVPQLQYIVGRYSAVSDGGGASSSTSPSNLAPSRSMRK